MVARQKPLIETDIFATFLYHTGRNPTKVFCYLYERRGMTAITFAELARTSAGFATLLQREITLSEGDTVAIILPHCPELLWTFLGVMCRGAIPSFMPFPSAKQSPEYYWRSHTELFDKIGVRLLISSNEYRRDIEQYLEIDVLYVEDIRLRLETERLAAVLPVAPAAIAFLQHSSGTTGLKKGTKLSHVVVMTQVDAYAREIGFADGHVIVSWLPLYHDMGLIACFMMPLLMGASVVMIDPFDWVARPWLMLDSIERHQANFAWVPNFALRHLVRTAPRGRTWDLSSLIALINCSEPCKPAEFDAFLDRFRSSGVMPRSLQVCYAMAENVFAVTQTALNVEPRVIVVDAHAMDAHRLVEPATEDGGRRRILSCGRPIKRTELRIKGPNGDLLSDRHVGEILIRSPWLFSGYNELPELTAIKLIDGWYHTGDLGFTDHSELFVTGRIDDLLIVYGRNYYAHEIEEAVNFVGGVVPGRAVAFTVESAATGTAEVVILAELTDAMAHAEIRRQIKAAVFDRLGLVVQTVQFRERGELVKSTAGKISRERNKWRYLGKLRDDDQMTAQRR